MQHYLNCRPATDKRGGSGPLARRLSYQSINAAQLSPIKQHHPATANQSTPPGYFQLIKAVRLLSIDQRRPAARLTWLGCCFLCTDRCMAVWWQRRQVAWRGAVLCTFPATAACVYYESLSAAYKLVYDHRNHPAARLLTWLGSCFLCPDRCMTLRRQRRQVAWRGPLDVLFLQQLHERPPDHRAGAGIIQILCCCAAAGSAVQHACLGVLL